MKLVLFRIDDRLVHAQVSVGWVRVLSPDLILLADDEVASQAHQIELLALGLPPKIELAVTRLKNAVDTLNRREQDGEKCILLVRGPAQAVEVLDAGVQVKSINIGGMHFAEGKRKLLPYVYVDRGDVEALEKLASGGTKLVAQDVPGNPAYDLLKLIRKSQFGKD